MAKKRFIRRKLRRSFRGFGVATASQGMRVLRTAAIDAEDGHCGPALERLGKAKVLLGSQASSSAASKLILDVKRYCPKSQVVLRADVAEELQQGMATSSPWDKFRQKWAHKRLEKPSKRKVWVPGEGWVWKAPTAAESALWRDLMEAKKLIQIAERKRTATVRKGGYVYRRTKAGPSRVGKRRGGKRAGAGRKAKN